MLRIKKADCENFHQGHRGKGLDKKQLTKAFMWTSRTFLVFIFIVLSFASLRMQIEYASRNTAIENDTNAYNYISHVSATLKIPDKVDHDEFFHKSPSALSLREKLKFIAPNWETDKSRLKLYPMWACEDDPNTRKNKVVYLHMSRSAGSTIRPMFRVYSKVCHRSIAFVSGCVDLGIESTSGDDLWQNGELSPYAARGCFLGSSTTREGDPIESEVKDRVSTNFLKENNFDVVAGHLPLGSHASWTDQQTLYVVMIRHPLTRFVSEMIYRYGSESMSIQELVTLINRTTTARLKKNEFRDSYASYFITPEQMKWADVENIELSTETRMNMALNNLLSGNVLLGLVERIPESLKMLQYAIDTTHHADRLFNYFASPTAVASVMKSSNKTQSVIGAIENDATLSANLQELLKYELKFHHHARQLHENQYKWMQEDTAATTE